ncbi:MAG: ribonuclease H-like domain-containing protein [Planctomycetota bacterium]
MSLTPLERTFCHLHAYGVATERSLWQKGFTSWYDVIGTPEPRVAAASFRRLRSECEESARRFFERDWKFFSRKLPPSEQWRLFASVTGPTAYLDIETTGVSFETDSVTIIGLYDGETAHVFMNYFRDLRERPPVRSIGKKILIQAGEKFPAKMAEMARIVSFNGKSFDIPILRNTFHDVDFDLPHLDLRIALRTLGLRGGLKKIEEQLGISRPSRVKGLHGRDAVELWLRYRNSNDLVALATLIEYNVQDIVNLENLTRIYIEKRLESFPGDTTSSL